MRDALRISTYEIFFLDKRFHAAVDQGVELVKSVAPPAAGLTNYVLRQLVRLRAEFPFADPNRDIEALARLHAFPAWQAALLMNDLGPEAAFEFMRASNEPAPLFVAVNAAKTRDELVLRAFERVGEQVERVEIEGSEVPGCLRLDDPRTLLLPDMKRLLNQGRILVSDAASQQVAASVLPEKKPASFLEVGAGRATKTILLQSARFADGAPRSRSTSRSTTARSRRRCSRSAWSASASTCPRRLSATCWTRTSLCPDAPSTRCFWTRPARASARCAAIPRSAGV